MNANDDAKAVDAVEVEVAKGEQDDVLEDSPQLSDKRSVKKELRPKLTPKPAKRDALGVTVKSFASARIEGLARPTKHRVLVTLQEKASTLSPTHVDNLNRLIEAESCLTPEEAARVLRLEKRKAKKGKRIPPRAKELAKQITKKLDATMMLDRDAMLCQYLMAERFVKTLLERRRPVRRKNFSDVAQVILKRMESLDVRAAVEDGDDRATQQLSLLADMIASWVIEILEEVTAARRKSLEEYCKEKQMKMMQVDDDDDDDDRTDSETEDWKLIEQIKKREQKAEEEKREREKYEAERSKGAEERSKERKEEDMVNEVTISIKEEPIENPEENERTDEESVQEEG